MGSTNSKSAGSKDSWLTYGEMLDRVKDGRVNRSSMIEVRRNNFSHWLILDQLVGNAIMVYHVAPVYLREGERGDFKWTRAIIRYHSLEEVLNDKNDLSSHYINPSFHCDNELNAPMSLCRVNNQEQMAKKMYHKYHIIESPDMERVFIQLQAMKDKEVDYNLLTLNCEHYVTFWRYGIGWCDQVPIPWPNAATELQHFIHDIT